jgi:hypothetical protein
MHAIRRHVQIQAGGTVTLQDADLPEGAEAEVIVLVASEADEAAPLPPMTSMIGAAPGGFDTPADADAYVRSLRDEWED